MRALSLSAVNQLALAEVTDPSPAPGEALVEIRAAALNHRDLWIKLGQYAGLKFPCIPGSDGAGVVTAVGSDADSAWVGREVILDPALDWGDDERAQSASFSILGLPRDGTLAEKVAVPVAQLAPKPGHLPWKEAAALPLAGLTAYRALLVRGQLHPGERVLISGVGGGAALFALQFAVAHGAEAWVTSGSKDKIARAVALGARGGFLYSNPGWTAGAARGPGQFDLIVDSAGGAGFNDLLEVAAPGGRIVFFGATRGGVPELPLRKVFWRQLSLLGSTMGSHQDWSAMLSFVARHRITPVVGAVYPLEAGEAAFALMEQGGQFGKIVLEVSR
jgi:NADPH:quinone reductase-like Zn-dependent oxidoreductase